MQDLKFIIISFLTWRLLLLIPVFVATALIPYREGFALIDFKNPLLYSWANFDGVHYLNIASFGYTTDGRFFPLYPTTIRLVSLFLRESGVYSGSHFFSGLFVANTAFLLALFFLYRLIKNEYSVKTSRWVIFFLLSFPTAFFFGSLYSESLFLLFLVLSFYLANQKKYLLGGIFGGLLAITRLSGIFIWPALIYQFLVMNFKKNAEGLKNLSWLIIFPPLGLLSFGYYSYLKFGKFFNFIYSHGQQANSREVDKIIFPLQTVYRYFKIIAETNFSQFEWWIAILEFLAFLYFLVLFYFAWKLAVKKSYLIFSFLSFLLPVLSGTFSGLPRYILVLFPLYIVLALIKNFRIKIAVAVTFGVLQFGLLMAFSRGYYIA